MHCDIFPEINLVFQIVSTLIGRYRIQTFTLRLDIRLCRLYLSQYITRHPLTRIAPGGARDKF
jgi:hypothetical protein